MNTKIIAGPLGFYAYCAPAVLAAGPILWTELHKYIGPLRDTQEEAEQDLRAMTAATTMETPTKEKPGRFTKMNDKTIRVLYGNAKARHKGLRPFFRDPHTMIALREEFERRFK